MLHRERGEMGELIALAEFAKHRIGVSVPWGDEHPFDLILYWKGRLFRAQVKSAKPRKGYTRFCLSSQNSTRYHTYTTADCDVMALCDYEKVYLLGPDEFSGRANFSIRTELARNRQTKGTHWHEDYVLSPSRIRRVLEGKP